MESLVYDEDVNTDDLYEPANIVESYDKSYGYYKRMLWYRLNKQKKHDTFCIFKGNSKCKIVV